MFPKEYDVSRKVVLITGAGRGIGRGIAEVLAEAGAEIALNALTDRYVKNTAREIATASGSNVVPMLADVTKTQEVNQLIERVLNEFGRLDVLVNCLGDAIRQPLVTFADDAIIPISDEDLKKIIDINLTGTILCTRAVGEYFIKQRRGKIINISSVTAGKGGGDLVLYTLAKAAIIGFTRTQALEWAPYNIQINSIAPGLFPDTHTYGDRAKLPESVLRRIPLGRAGLVREVGLLALYLASPASDYMTGQAIFLDGGLSL
ncbi:MAG TPA: SDR family oxidoreductase [Dehalococcoidia bacterium]|nr:SDR family oxidoreductase [Dehalococcoidia bacterium]